MIKKSIFINSLKFISNHKSLSYLFSLLLILVLNIYNFKLLIKKKTIKGIALSFTRFRYDLDILNQSSEISIYKIPLKIQYLLLIPFEKYLYQYKDKYYSDDEKLKKIKLKNQEYLSRILRDFFKHYKFILTASVSYIQDYDLAKSAEKNALKHIILMRENFGIVEKQALDIMRYYYPFEKSDADLVIVHNQSTKRIFKDIKMFNKSNIEALGCVRMDEYIKKLNLGIPKKNYYKKIITFFSFATNSGCHLAETPMISAFEKNRGLITFFKNTHNDVILFAKDNPKIQIYIKTKWSQNWIDLILKNWREFSGNSNFPENCKVTSYEDPHKLIMFSDLVIGFNSTTLLEAGLRDIPIIIPKFDEASGLYDSYFNFAKYEKSFLIVKDKSKFYSTIEKTLSKSSISEDIKNIRKKLFQKYVSNIDGQSKGRYIEAIKKTIL